MNILREIITRREVWWSWPPFRWQFGLAVCGVTWMLDSLLRRSGMHPYFIFVWLYNHPAQYGWLWLSVDHLLYAFLTAWLGGCASRLSLLYRDQAARAIITAEEGKQQR